MAAGDRQTYTRIAGTVEAKMSTWIAAMLADTISMPKDGRGGQGLLHGMASLFDDALARSVASVKESMLLECSEYDFDGNYLIYPLFESGEKLKSPLQPFYNGSFVNP